MINNFIQSQPPFSLTLRLGNALLAYCNACATEEVERFFEEVVIREVHNDRSHILLPCLLFKYHYKTNQKKYVEILKSVIQQRSGRQEH